MIQRLNGTEKRGKFHLLELGQASNDRTCIIDYQGKTIFKSSLGTVSLAYYDSFSKLFTRSR